MPKVGYRHTPETKQKMRMAKLGKPSNNRAWMQRNFEHYGHLIPFDIRKKISEGVRKKISEGVRKKISVTPEARQKMRMARIGYCLPPEVRKKISDTIKAKGMVPPSRTGAIPWNKGLKARDDPRVAYLVEKAHEGWRRKFNTATKRRAHAHRAVMANHSVSKLEQDFLDWLEAQLGKPVKRQVYLPNVGVVDGLIGSVVVVEVEGTYWHREEEVQATDARKRWRARTRGFSVVRCSEALIRKDRDRLLRKVIRVLASRKGSEKVLCEG